MGPDSCPRWFLVLLLGGGGAELFCWNGGRSKEGEQPSCGKTQCASTLGNQRGEEGRRGERGGGAWGSKKKCFSIALRHTLVVLEMH